MHIDRWTVSWSEYQILLLIQICNINISLIICCIDEAFQLYSLNIQNYNWNKVKRPQKCIKISNALCAYVLQKQKVNFDSNILMDIFDMNEIIQLPRWVLLQQENTI